MGKASHIMYPSPSVNSILYSKWDSQGERNSIVNDATVRITTNLRKRKPGKYDTAMPPTNKVILTTKIVNQHSFKA